MKKLMLIVNPNAGRGAYKVNFVEALNMLDRNGYSVTLFFTRQPGDATMFVEKYAKSFDTIICMGTLV